MKTIMLMMVMAFMAVPVMAQDGTQAAKWLKPMKPEYVCMVNDKAFESPQIPVSADGKTYYGCCPACKAALENDPSMRSAVDPVSGNTIDKTEAIIGAGPDQTVYYFENEDNFNAFASGPVPETKN